MQRFVENGMLSHIWTIMGIALVFAPLEFLLPARSAPAFNWRRYRTDLLHAVLGGLLIRLAYAILIAMLIDWIGIKGSAWQYPLWLQVIAVLVICDLSFWTAHRLFHAVPFLWRFHEVHHSSAHLDWLAAYRVHPVDQAINSAMIMLPVLVLGFAPKAILIYGVIYQWHAILLHSNVRFSLGWFGNFVATPQFHHWHHANQQDAYDRNFGGQLTIWDRLFGTAYHADAIRPPSYGVDRPPAEGFLSHLASPFKRNSDGTGNPVC